MKREHADEIAVYRPNQRHDIGLFRTWAVMFDNVRRSRHLVWQLFKRDFLAQYKKSFLGLSWLFLGPLLAIVQWVVLKRTNLLRPGQMPGGVPFTVYVLVGSTMYGFFVRMLVLSGKTLTAGRTIAIQVNYSHDVLLFKQIAQALATFSIAFVMNICVLLAFGIVPDWRVALMPVVLLPACLLASGLGLIIAMFAALTMDISRGVERGMALVMMLTPIVYVMKQPEKIASGDTWNLWLQRINAWNPLTYLVCSARDMVLSGEMRDPVAYAVWSGASLVLFLFAWRLFYVSEDKLIERML